MTKLSLRNTLLGCAVAAGLLATGGFTSAQAAPVVWDFTPAADTTFGPTKVYSTTPAVTPAQNITASGFSASGAVNLFGKNEGPTEMGLGLTNDPQHEITFGSFIQLDLSNLSSPPLQSLHFSFQANSTSDGETWVVYGTNTAGSLNKATKLDSGTNNNLVSDLGPSILGTYTYLDVTVAHQGQNVLLRELDNSVPEPASLIVLGSSLLGLGLWRHRRQAL